MSTEKEHTNYPARHAVGEIIEIDFFNNGPRLEGKVEAVIFTRDGKVFYDIGVRSSEETGCCCMLHKIDSVFVTDRAKKELQPDLATA